MFQPGILFALFIGVFWLYCLIDAAFAPAAECTGLSKRGWLLFIGLTFVVGAIVWMMCGKVRRLQRLSQSPPQTGSASASLARHPSARVRRTHPARTTPIGPDDDPEFLRMLDRRISGTQDSTE